MRLLLAALAVVFLSAAAHAVAVDIELVLAVDASRSIDEEEARLQRQGYVAALTDRRVLQAIESGPQGRIAVMYFEWAGAADQQIIAAWTLIKDEESARYFAALIATAPRMSRNWTSISGAIDFAVPLFDNNGFEGTRKVIDVSGDGRNNQGRPADMARDDAVAKGITINGLPILGDRVNFGQPAEVDLDGYYRDSVIGGPGSFMIAAKNFDDFTGAILSKLIREIAGEYAVETAENLRP